MKSDVFVNPASLPNASAGQGANAPMREYNAICICLCFEQASKIQ